MTPGLLWRPQARRDLFTILTMLESRSPAAALKMRQQIERDVDLLAHNPRLGRLRPDIAPAARALLVEKILLVYRLLPADTADPVSQILIVRVLHGSRDLASVM